MLEARTFGCSAFHELLVNQFAGSVEYHQRDIPGLVLLQHDIKDAGRSVRLYLERIVPVIVSLAVSFTVSGPV